MISKIRVINFPGLEDGEYNLSMETLIEGGDSTGKTSFLNAISFGLLGKGLNGKSVRGIDKKTKVVCLNEDGKILSLKSIGNVCLTYNDYIEDIKEKYTEKCVYPKNRIIRADFRDRYSINELKKDYEENKEGYLYSSALSSSKNLNEFQGGEDALSIFVISKIQESFIRLSEPRQKSLKDALKKKFKSLPKELTGRFIFGMITPEGDEYASIHIIIKFEGENIEDNMFFVCKFKLDELDELVELKEPIIKIRFNARNLSQLDKRMEKHIEEVESSNEKTIKRLRENGKSVQEYYDKINKINDSLFQFGLYFNGSYITTKVIFKGQHRYLDTLSRTERFIYDTMFFNKYLDTLYSSSSSPFPILIDDCPISLSDINEIEAFLAICRNRQVIVTQTKKGKPLTFKI